MSAPGKVAALKSLRKMRYRSPNARGRLILAQIPYAQISDLVSRGGILGPRLGLGAVGEESDEKRKEKGTREKGETGQFLSAF